MKIARPVLAQRSENSSFRRVRRPAFLCCLCNHSKNLCHQAGCLFSTGTQGKVPQPGQIRDQIVRSPRANWFCDYFCGLTAKIPDMAVIAEMRGAELNRRFNSPGLSPSARPGKVRRSQYSFQFP